MDLINTIGVFIGSISFVCLCRNLLRRRVPRLPLPPGPSLLPIPIPEQDILRTFQKWHIKYGPLISFAVGSQTVIIIGDRKLAHDLLEKRGNIYSSRPKSIFIGKYLTKGLQPAFMQYDAVWRLHHKLQVSLLSSQACQAYRRIHELESKRLVYDFLSTNKLKNCFLLFTASTMFTLLYGRELSIDDLDMQEIKHIDEIIEFLLRSVSVGSFLVDSFPILDRLPRYFTKWKSLADQTHENTKKAFTECLDIGMQDSGWNWSREVLNKKEAQELTREQLAFTMGDLYIAGVYSNKMVLETFVMASLLHPIEVQKAQEELDSVVGLQRLPSFEDEGKLPYVDAFISELFRWRQIDPLAVPHSVAVDDEYMGYTIPANSVVIANQWQMNMDEGIFDDPDSFQPDRWIGNPNLPLFSFGFGRRKCPGQGMTRSMLFIAISRLLWAYNPTRLVEDRQRQRASGQSGCLGGEYRPQTFNTCFEIRSPQHKEVIEREWITADKDRKKILADIGNTVFWKKE